MEIVFDQLPRLIAMFVSIYCALILLTRWRVTRLMTPDKRFLLLFLVTEVVVVCASVVLKVRAGAPVDPSSWLTVFLQLLLGGYLHHAIPAHVRRPHHWITRRHLRR